ncbi:MAG: hypothetical protein IJI16_02180 [Atopobiaceae bacterium]|nr:hypothetical protein [Atopobiaceae bacterium]MBQ3282560.1 hypothetical protein [Atopobiaceae bacterium]MBQ6410739.1 hypothetical protein [Atopobiaceae bacterium]MBQ6650510.1 hypothetical protein [Atopobiaceae bacterium]
MPTLELATVWPIVLVVLGNVVYQICSKSIPADVHPLAAVAVILLAVGYLLLHEEISATKLIGVAI